MVKVKQYDRTKNADWLKFTKDDIDTIQNIYELNQETVEFIEAMKIYGTNN